ncbi:hypothetical protein GLOIN_2v1546814 [Rhizophagus clarus]|uniref:Uncharacterized protein n=1 Tax=Rhizophagus clarus TaxID=94130 RepID=A0A8H3L176_9GLOM|nr:hypothetical protein GLOIN_2v1546814 [Rhizophagus clarus]
MIKSQEEWEGHISGDYLLRDIHKKATKAGNRERTDEVLVFLVTSSDETSSLSSSSVNEERWWKLIILTSKACSIAHSYLFSFPTHQHIHAIPGQPLANVVCEAANSQSLPSITRKVNNFWLLQNRVEDVIVLKL